jgi:(2Fe-2S) ferredoxin
VVYPEAVWYTYIDKEDIDEIIEEHLDTQQQRGLRYNGQNTPPYLPEPLQGLQSLNP